MSGGEHWAAAEIGKPWVPMITDCWSFARYCWQERFGWEVPPIMIDPSDARAARQALSVPPERLGWDAIATPREGDAVLMARGARPCHVGIWIEPEPDAGILHSVERSGVIFTPPARLAGVGYRVVGYYRRPA